MLDMRRELGLMDCSNAVNNILGGSGYILIQFKLEF